MLREAEDLAVLKGLANEVATELKGGLRKRKAIGIGISILIATPAFGFFGNSTLVALIAAGIAICLTYLSITGSSLMRTKLDPVDCVTALETKAKERELITKLKRFDLAWDKDGFRIEKADNQLEPPQELALEGKSID